MIHLKKISVGLNLIGTMSRWDWYIYIYILSLGFCLRRLENVKNMLSLNSGSMVTYGTKYKVKDRLGQTKTT